MYNWNNNTSIVIVGEARSIIVSTASPMTHTSYNTQAKKK